MVSKSQKEIRRITIIAVVLVLSYSIFIFALGGYLFIGAVQDYESNQIQIIGKNVIISEDVMEILNTEWAEHEDKNTEFIVCADSRFVGETFYIDDAEGIEHPEQKNATHEQVIFKGCEGKDVFIHNHLNGVGKLSSKDITTHINREFALSCVMTNVDEVSCFTALIAELKTETQ